MNNSNKNIKKRNKITKGLEKAYQKMLEFKKKNNGVIVILKDNKVVTFKPK